MSRFKLTPVAAAVIGLCATASHAGESPTDPILLAQLSLPDVEPHENRLDPVVVTPSMTTQTARASLTPVAVIDEQTLREQQPLEMADILRAQPGLDIIGNGAFGKNTSVYMRGTGGSSTLLLLDGVRIRPATGGTPSWQFLPPSMIDRVEVVRGPRGSLYGSDAVGGVVQVFTPDGHGEPGAWLELGGGSFNTRSIGGGAAGEKDGTRYSMAVNRFDTDGTRLRQHGDDRGYDNTSGIVKLSHRFGERAEIGVMGFRAEGNTEFEPGTAANREDTDYLIQVGALRGELLVSDDWLMQLQVSEARDENENFTDGDLTSTFNTKTQAVNLKNHFAVNDYVELIVGGEYLRDDIESTTQYSLDNRENKAAFAQLMTTFGDLDAQASVRYDDNEAFGHKSTGGVALGYALNPHHRVRVSYGTAFRAPTFNELYYPGFGNPDLSPEKSENKEIGIRGQYGRGFWDLSVFQNDVEDLIASELRDGKYLPYNVNEARIRGAELQTGLDLDQWRLAMAVTVLDPKDKETDELLQRRNRKSVRFDVDRDFGSVSLGGSAVFQDHRYNDAAATQRLPGYGLLDLRASWRFAPDWTTRVSVKNVFDKEYATARNYSGWHYLNAGRTVFVSVRYDIR
ncbi:TonB-dependent receptor domain-containing protein [Alloalcanivorax xenomutans]|uniref:TonB-dependent receptor domain-containing protein n=1 Tax=Alloalcanivorax xenomutans TaxID=1094342 RepID=UPI00292FDCDF|nr:TonB-dependent receptor [Alloalcanivorax xenomutans]WOA31155.1 TonB-dependent receptor [Alloalcanivorax xenomutans]